MSVSRSFTDFSPKFAKAILINLSTGYVSHVAGRCFLLNRDQAAQVRQSI